MQDEGKIEPQRFKNWMWTRAFSTAPMKMSGPLDSTPICSLQVETNHFAQHIHWHTPFRNTFLSALSIFTRTPTNQQMMIRHHPTLVVMGCGRLWTNPSMWILQDTKTHIRSQDLPTRCTRRVSMHQCLPATSNEWFMRTKLNSESIQSKGLGTARITLNVTL